MVIFIPSSVLVALIGWYVYWKNTRNKILIDKVPGFKDWPLVGDVLHLERDPTGEMIQSETTHGKVLSRLQLRYDDEILHIQSFL